MSQTQTPAAPAAPNRRGNLLRGLFVIVVLLLAALALWYFMFGRWFEETDDAYVSADMVAVSSHQPKVVAAHLPARPARGVWRVWLEARLLRVWA